MSKKLSIVLFCMILVASFGPALAETTQRAADPVATGDNAAVVQTETRTETASDEDATAREQVASALADVGLNQDEINQRLASMTDEDLRYFAGHEDQIQAAGQVPDYIWLLLAIFLGVAVLTAVF